MPTDLAFEFIEEIDHLTDAHSLVASFQALIAKFGLVYVMVGDPRPPPARNDYLWATTWPSAWLDRWTSRNYLQVDPVVRKIRMQNRPLRWSRTQPAVGEPGSHVLLEAGEFGMNDGLAVPVYSRDGLSMIVSMGAEHYELGRADESRIHLAAIYFHGRLELIRAKNAPPPRGPRLTRRERECLSWVAAGKTDWEISQILNIAEQTVHEYVQNALIKLGATTRAQAVANAMITKQITL
ncbi:MAG TPA: LuxR family transcriptional regulator [Rhizomicrobium sp.]